MTSLKREARRLRRDVINGAAYGQPLGDRIPVTPELQDALSEAAQREGEGILLTDHPEFFGVPPVAYPVEGEAVASWDDIDMSPELAAAVAAGRVEMRDGFAYVQPGVTALPTPAVWQEVPPIREQILVEAGAAVMGDRDRSYGGPEDSFTRIAALWNAQFSDLLRQPFEAHHIPTAMVCLKLARIAQNPTYRDGYVDGAGYFACGAEVAGAVA